MEWMLNRAVFDSIMRRYGMCEVDLFASSQNYQMIPYVSYLPDRCAMAINAFSLNWTDYYSYIFGPFSTDGAILQKKEEEKADAVMVEPLFTTQSWFPNYYK